MLTKNDAIAPHGGTLIDRAVPAEERQERLREAAELPKVFLGPRTISDLQMISTGVFSLLEGFMRKEEYESVVEDMRLTDGLAWSLPVTLASSEDTAHTLREGSEVALVDGDGESVATMLLRERYRYDKEREARMVYRTTDEDHPGVKALYRQGDVLLGGEVNLLQAPDRGRFPCTTTIHASCAQRLLRRAGSASWASRPATPSTGPTSTSRRAPSKPSTASSSTHSSARPSPTTFPRRFG